ncbi:MAG: sulfite exporter TauE/SafE family protein [Pseudomonadota bacterium]
MIAVLLLGFLIGVRHALDADHVAAVASLVVGSKSVAQSVRQGVVWGIGHTLTLFSVGTVVVLAGTRVSPRLEVMLEAVVGLMLIGLGVDVARRLIAERVHFHTHRHEDGVEHFHAHSHRAAAKEAHDARRHAHSHAPAAQGFPARALVVGLMHGLAGSAALVILSLESTGSLVNGLLYMLLFGLGSILGMAALSAVIAVPLNRSEHRLTHLHRGAQAAVVLLNVGLGSTLLAGAWAG